MLRNMRRSERQMTDIAVKQVLASENWGVLSVCGDDGFPYGVPINYAYWAGALYLHCSSATSHKLDGIRRCNKVCFTVVSQHQLDPKNLACTYESVIVFGTATIVESEKEKLEAMMFFMRGLAPEMINAGFEKCDPKTSGLSVVKIEPILITGKHGQ